MSLWEARRLDADTCYETKLGLLRLWLKHSHVDWNVAWKLDDFSSRRDLLRSYQRPVRLEPPGLYPAGWKRWVFENGTDTARLTPLSPDRSLVVQPDVATRIAPGQGAMIFVTIPLWIGLLVGEGAGQLLCEVPTTVLSNTWYGDFASGELCYALRSRAKRRLPAQEDALHNAVCPVSVTNKGSTHLEFVHICIQSEHLAIYQGTGRLWTNRVDVVFEGQESQTTMSSGGPDLEGEVALLQPPRRVADRSLVRKGFQFLRGLAGFPG